MMRTLLLAGTLTLASCGPCDFLEGEALQQCSAHYQATHPPGTPPDDAASRFMGAYLQGLQAVPSMQAPAGQRCLTHCSGSQCFTRCQ